MKQISKTMTVIDALQVDPRVADELMNVGMECIFCMAAYGETLQEAGYVHGIDDPTMDKIVADINQMLAEEPEGDKAGAKDAAGTEKPENAADGKDESGADTAQAEAVKA